LPRGFFREKQFTGIDSRTVSVYLDRSIGCHIELGLRDIFRVVGDHKGEFWQNDNYDKNGVFTRQYTRNMLRTHISFVHQGW
jgi:hypothetical protein